MVKYGTGGNSKRYFIIDKMKLLKTLIRFRKNFQIVDKEKDEKTSISSRMSKV